MTKLEENMNKFNNNLSPYACLDSEGIRLKPDKEDYRTPYFRDIDRVIYSLSYIRYIDKTQVFSYKQNDHLSKRMIHVQFVSKIARTIGRALNLNEDLIEAAALGHDLGHVPFGHVGEKILNDISVGAKVGYFNHNIHSVRLLMFIEKYGEGQNLNYQVLDAIMCHNGELTQNIYRPKKKSVKEFIKEYEDSYTNKNVKLIPGTLEGCVVRVSDIIGYLGRDLEDGIRLGLIKKDDIPIEISNVLGINNKQIVNTIVTDIINNSIDKNYIKLSDKVFDAVNKLKTFNYEYIYAKAYSKEERLEIEKMFYTLYAKFLNDLKTNNKESIIYTSYLNNMNESYNNNPKERIVIDYIAGMTDDYFKRQYELINKDM
jgi:dGTPase